MRKEEEEQVVEGCQREQYCRDCHQKEKREGQVVFQQDWPLLFPPIPFLLEKEKYKKQEGGRGKEGGKEGLRRYYLHMMLWKCKRIW